MTATRPFHVEVQEVVYRRYVVQARHREEAEALVMDGQGRLTRIEHVSRLPTVTHEPLASCMVNCVGPFDSAAAKVMSMLEANRRALPGGPVVSQTTILEAAGFSKEDISQALETATQIHEDQLAPDLGRGASFLDPGLIA